MTEPVACTIVSNNYLAFARVWASSLLARHPGTDIVVLIVDTPDPAIDYAAEPFRVVFAHQLDIPAFRHFAFKYSLLELNTAVKPYFLEHLHREQSAEIVLYFDPDIQILGSLDPLFAQLAVSNMILTPHLLQPLEDDRRPTERNILMAGVYNLGFLGLRLNDRTLEFLHWWQRRLYSHCLHRIADGLFVDQRWMDLAPSLLDDVLVLRDPGYNVAYWNLANRRLEKRADVWTVNGVPLRFFHFSGVAVDDLDRLSKYQDRYRLSDRPDLEPLFEGYRQAILRAGWEDTKTADYGYGRFDNGIGIPELSRVALRTTDSTGDRWPDPFAVTGTGSYWSWLTERLHADEGDDAWLPRIALILWEHRPDLQSAFPQPLGADHAPYVRWLLSAEPQAAGVDDELLQGIETIELATTATAASSAEIELELLAIAADFETAATPRIPRIAALIWEKRPDLQEAFPAPLGQNRQDFARWFVTFGRLEYRLPAMLWRPTLEQLPLLERLRAHAWRFWQRSRARPVDSRGSWRDFGPQTREDLIGDGSS